MGQGICGDGGEGGVLRDTAKIAEKPTAQNFPVGALLILLIKLYWRMEKALGFEGANLVTS